MLTGGEELITKDKLDDFMNSRVENMATTDWTIPKGNDYLRCDGNFQEYDNKETYLEAANRNRYLGLV